ncbi:alginate O-acetyltransferase AlgX-related protein [Anthocerotibacter panamensis]|uniref:alginate O-acetyltransferase AlgX-related protein n=1 Tax=Anthocerotibacter panamensis TaxID=2857077 RepID=UPI001C4025A6|nr:hypothetical protein [Anthocerotibacter panamensis]
MAKRLSWLVNIGLVVGSLLVAVLILEGGIRLVGPLLAPNLRVALFERAADEDLFDFVSGIGTMSRPDLDRPNIRINDTEVLTVHTDHQGFRNPPDRQGAPIAFLGDSFVWGFGVSQAETWVSQVGQLLGQKTASYGQSGFSSWQYARVFDRYVASRHPRLVVWAFFANDLQPVAERIKTGQPIDRGVQQWLDSHSLIYRLGKFIVQGAYLSDQQPVSYRDRDLDLVLFPITHNILNPQYPDFAPGLQEFKTSIADVKTGCQQSGCQLVVVLIPTKEMVYLPRVSSSFTPEQQQMVTNAFKTYRDLQSFLTQEQIPSLDLTAALQTAALPQAQPAQTLYFRIDGHWNKLGHQAAAQALAQFLKQQKRLGTVQ